MDDLYDGGGWDDDMVWSDDDAYGGYGPYPSFQPVITQWGVLNDFNGKGLGFTEGKLLWDSRGGALPDIQAVCVGHDADVHADVVMVGCHHNISFNCTEECAAPW
jgi:hypothetical protein